MIERQLVVRRSAGAPEDRNATMNRIVIAAAAADGTSQMLRQSC
jgi:hypothetical protein